MSLMNHHKKLPPLPAKYSDPSLPPGAEAAFVDEYDFRGSVAVVALIELLAGIALVWFGIRESNVSELALGTVFVLVAVIGAVASGGFLDKPYGRPRAVLSSLPILTLWLFGAALLVFLGYAVIAAILMLKWLLLPLALVMVLSVVLATRLHVLDHLSLPSLGQPMGSNHPVNQGPPMPVDPRRHRESEVSRKGSQE